MGNFFSYPNRSTERELIDDPIVNTPEAQSEYDDCVEQLARIGTILGGTRAGINVLKAWLPEGGITLLDVGCGGGHFARAVVREFPGLKVVGVDTEISAIRIAERERARLPVHEAKRLEFVCLKSPSLASIEGSFDFVTATLVAHHINDADLPRFLNELAHRCRRAFLINDLERNRIADYSFRLLARTLFRNRLVINDGPISVRRGFVREDFVGLFEAADLLKSGSLEIRSEFPFRWMVTWKRAS